MNSSRLYRWTPLIVATLLVMAVTPVFWVTPLDLTAAAWFFDPSDPANVWPHEDDLLWAFFYEASWILSLLILLAAVALIILARSGRLAPVWSPRGWALLLVLVLGAGLVVNLIFKDNFGRYRPRQTEPLGGAYEYQVPLQPGIPGTGRSFPSGHPSPAFALTLLYFFWRGRRPRLAWAALLGALSLGALMGAGRMAAGAHFLSDVIWTGYFMFATAAVVYYAILGVPEQEARIARGAGVLPFTRWQKVGLTTVVGLAVASSLFTKPVGFEFELEVPASELAGLAQIRLQYDSAELQVVEVADGAPLSIDVTSRSFGMPGAGIDRHLEQTADRLTLSVSHQGRFTERGTVIRVEIPASARDRLVLQEVQP